jgi:stage II sporulation protein P
MRMCRRGLVLVMIALALTALLQLSKQAWTTQLPEPAWVAQLPEQTWTASPSEPEECTGGSFYTVYDQADPNTVVFQTGMGVAVGDQYQTEDDRLYEVISVDEGQRTAIARFLEQVQLSADTLAFIENLMASAPKAGKGQVTVGVYHTHSSESYVPSDGTDSIRGNGGIFKVGAALVESLKEAGARVVYSDSRHDPHDSAAYTRSRRTAQQLLRQGSTALLDVHRDAGGGPQSYSTTVDGRNVSQIRLVVGRQNPNMSTNKQFAQEIKAATDKQVPGLIKGIFFARGGYNQDLSGRNLLLEVGTDTSSREDAAAGASLFAKVYANYLGARTSAAQAGQNRESGAGSRAALWMVGLVIVGASAWLLLSTGGWNEASSKLRTFVTKEFSNALGTARRPKHRQKGPGDDEGDRNR